VKFSILPELDVTKVRRYAEGKHPRRLRGQVRAEVQVHGSRVSGLGSRVTIVECPAPWHEAVGSQRSRQPVAEFRYDQVGQHWTLYWPDADGR